MLQGFEKFEVSSGVASVTISSYGVGFSKTAVHRMNKCEHVMVYVDYNGKRFAIQMCDEKEDGSTTFYRGQRNSSVRWNNRELVKTLSNMMEWDLSKRSYKVEGEYDPEEHALIFELEKAKASDR